MEPFSRAWFVVGGWALDLHLGRVTRPHEDVDLGLLREDQAALQDHLQGWRLEKVRPPGGAGALVPWRRGERLDLPLHEVHARRKEGSPRHLEFLLNEGEGSRWRYRRDPRLTRPLDRAVRRGALGIPHLAPEVVLLYKAKRPQPKDDGDLETVLPSLGEEARRWLRGAVARCHPASPWRGRLGNP